MSVIPSGIARFGSVPSQLADYFNQMNALAQQQTPVVNGPYSVGGRTGAVSGSNSIPSAFGFPNSPGAQSPVTNYPAGASTVQSPTSVNPRGISAAALPYGSLGNIGGTTIQPPSPTSSDSTMPILGAMSGLDLAMNGLGNTSPAPSFGIDTSAPLPAQSSGIDLGNLATTAALTGIGMAVPAVGTMMTAYNGINGLVNGFNSQTDPNAVNNPQPSLLQQILSPVSTAANLVGQAGGWLTNQLGVTDGPYVQPSPAGPPTPTAPFDPYTNNANYYLNSAQTGGGSITAPNVQNDLYNNPAYQNLSGAAQAPSLDPTQVYAQMMAAQGPLSFGMSPYSTGDMGGAIGFGGAGFTTPLVGDAWAAGESG